MWKELKRQWRLLFTFSAGERKGILLLSMLLMLGIGLYILLPFFIKPDDSLLLQSSQLALDWNEEVPEAAVHLKKQAYKEDVKEKEGLPPFPFDPNRITEEEGRRLGLSEKQISNILNYRKAGGSFKRKSDLKKLYSIRPEQYSRLEPYILLPDSFLKRQAEKYARPEYTARKRTELIPIDINAADSAGFVSLRGIGPGFAGRIIKYRNRLGGFVSMNQLKEVWGFSDSLYDVILPQIKLETGPVKKISINEASAEELKVHPYIWKYQLAQAIVNYRQQHGPYRSVDDLKKVLVIPDSTINRLAPYLSF